MRSGGATALLRTGKTLVEIATEVGVSKSLVHYWVTGDKNPGKDKRERLLELYGIPVTDWDVDASTPPKTPPRAIPAAPPPIRVESVAESVGGAFAMARELQQSAEGLLRTLREQGETDGDGHKPTPLERAKVMASLSTTIVALGKMTGDYDISRRLTKLPLWRRLETELAAALRGHPEAARAVAEVFERLDAAESGG
ncbi:MAG: helix-turn-helix transcriptional regulator [Polyangiaceae bacterium]|nr:helix-turn-helix transcriptional regulator [Polyangiaceae bacterium]